MGSSKAIPTVWVIHFVGRLHIGLWHETVLNVVIDHKLSTKIHKGESGVYGNQESRERLSRNRTGQSPGIFVVPTKALKLGTARIKGTCVYKGYTTQEYPQLCNVLNN